MLNKRWTKRVIIASLLALVVVVNSPAFLPQNITTANAVEGEITDEAARGTAEEIETQVTSDTAKTTAGTALSKDATKKLAGTFSLLITVQSVLDHLLWPVLIMIGNLLDNSVLFGSGMEERLREIWVPIRNIVNILFVIFLLGIALYNILGLGDENSNYSIKSMLPKLIIGIIAVNFSFFVMKIALDAVNVMTSAIFALPNQVSEDISKVFDTDGLNPNSSEYKRKMQAQERFCTLLSHGKISEMTSISDQEFESDEQMRYRISIIERDYKEITDDQINKAASPEELNRLVRAEYPDRYEQYDLDSKSGLCSGRVLTNRGEAYMKTYSSRNAALAMAINMGNIVFYQDVPIKLKNADQLVINSLFSVLLYLVYTVSFLALFVVLLARLLVLWLAIAMSPILLLIMFVPDIKDKLGDFGNLADQVVKNAIAPILIALAMSVGWIMLQAVRSVNSNESAMFSLQNGLPVVGLATLQDLIVALGTVGVVWLGVFSAAKGTIAEGVTDFMKDKLQSGAKYIATLPLKYTPLMPVTVIDPETGKVKQENITVTQLGNALQDFERQAAEPDKFSRFLGFGGGGRKEDVRTASDPHELLYALHNNADAFKKKELDELLRSNNNLSSIIAALKATGKRDDAKRADILEKASRGKASETERKWLIDNIPRAYRYPKKPGATPAAGTSAAGTSAADAPDRGKLKDDFNNALEKVITDRNTLEAASTQLAEAAATLYEKQRSGDLDQLDTIDKVKTQIETLHYDNNTSTVYPNLRLDQVITDRETLKELRDRYDETKKSGDPVSLDAYWDNLRGRDESAATPAPAPPPAPSPPPPPAPSPPPPPPAKRSSS